MGFILNMKQKNKKKCTVAGKALELEILLNVIRQRVTGLIRGLNRYKFRNLERGSLFWLIQ